MYDVVLLVERRLNRTDAVQVAELHTEIEDTVRYHVLMPAEDVAGRLQASMGSLMSPDGMAPAPALPDVDTQEIVREAAAEDRSALDESVEAVRSTGHEVTGRVVTGDPIEALTSVVRDLGAAEAIVLTEPHVVKEFFHVDWTARARRHLDVPILHLLEHEPVEAQAGGAGEGPSVI
jgi:hypothetical protein